jgi:hypothetical protein
VSYQDEVQADSPYAYFADASAAPWNDVEGGNDVAITGATANVAGPLGASQDTKAFSFDGTDDFGQVSLDLSDTQVVTVEMWLWWDSFGTGFDLAYEYTADWNLTGGIVFDPDHSDSVVSIGHTGNVGQNEKMYTRPSAAEWHHYAVVHDFTQAAANEITAYLDGALWTPSSQPQTANNPGSHVASTLNLMCRNGASLFGDGDMAHLAIYKSALSAGRVTAHFEAADDVVVAPSLHVVQSNLRLA